MNESKTRPASEAANIGHDKTQKRTNTMHNNFKSAVAILALIAGLLVSSTVLAGEKTDASHDIQSGQMMRGQMRSNMMGQDQGMMMQAPMMGQMCRRMMMQPEMMGQGMMDQGRTDARPPTGLLGGFPKLFSVEEAKDRVEKWLSRLGNRRLKLGTVEERGEFAIIAEITTTDDSLVTRLVIDRRNGSIWETG